MEVNVKIRDIDYFIKKNDALIVYMKNGKAWVCIKDQKMSNNNEFIKLKLKTDGKGKCGK